MTDAKSLLVRAVEHYTSVHQFSPDYVLLVKDQERLVVGGLHGRCSFKCVGLRDRMLAIVRHLQPYHITQEEIENATTAAEEQNPPWTREDSTLP